MKFYRFAIVFSIVLSSLLFLKSASCWSTKSSSSRLKIFTGRHLVQQKHHHLLKATTLDSPVSQTSDSEPKSSSSSAVRFTGSSGAAIEISNVFIGIGNNDILNSINWTILPKERWGLVGRNGEGKSTLLKAITQTAGEMVSIREGLIQIAKKARMGYLEQKGVSGSTLSVRDEVSSRMDRYTSAVERLESAEKAVSGGDISEDALVALDEATIEFEAAGGYTIEQKISNVLKGLGFLEDDYGRKCSEFSGGWQMRIALARLLLSEPDLLLLDEPTNHLDKGAREWLGSYLSRYDGTLMVVSHDENLLKAAVSSIAEVKNGQIELYKSRSYDQWLVERDERVRAALVAYEANQREIARLQTFVDRFGAKTMGASLAQSKLKTIEKLESAAPEAPKTGDGPIPKLVLPTPPRGSERLLELHQADISWFDDESKATKPILKDVNIVIERGMRIAVRGPNGAGKSTLFSALSGELTLSNGKRVEGDGLELGIFKQDLAQDLDQEATATDVVVRNVRHKNPSISDEKARTVLGALGLMKEKGVRLVGHLSGGEKARVALASFVLIPHNLLLLDEPSNHLDVTTIKVITGALKKYEGTVVVISHDRTFLEEFAPTHVLTVRDGTARLEERELTESDWADDLNSRENTSKFASSSAEAPSVSGTEKGKNNFKGSNKGGSNKAVNVVAETATQEIKLSAAEKSRRVTKIESTIAKHEKEIAKLGDDMMNNGKNRDKLMELQKQIDDANSKVAKLYAEYETLI